jgi:hypothetical protein
VPFHTTAVYVLAASVHPTAKKSRKKRREEGREEEGKMDIKEERTKRRKDARKERDGGKTEMKEKSTAGTGCATTV